MLCSSGVEAFAAARFTRASAVVSLTRSHRRGRGIHHRQQGDDIESCASDKANCDIIVHGVDRPFAVVFAASLSTISLWQCGVQ